MTTSIPFKVIFASDEDPDFPASELNIHSPTVLGWRSGRDKKGPEKELILQFDMPAEVIRIQVLTHQFIIPCKIEFWIFNTSLENSDLHNNPSLEYLGFISISDNSTTNYKSRELQNVPVGPKVASHLKLCFGEPHPNSLNTYNQAALVAINVIGIKQTTDQKTEKTASIDTNYNLISICDDLSFSMYVEKSVAEVIQEMEAKKCQAVKDERFEYARKLKLCMHVLRNAGERLGRYALAKRQAVQQEDFVTATLRKEQIDLYKNSVFKKLLVETLMEKTGMNAENDTVSDVYVQKPTLPIPPSLQEVAIYINESSNNSSETPSIKCSREEQTFPNKTTTFDGCISPQFQQTLRSPSQGSPVPSTGSLRRRNKSVPRNSYEDYDERAVSSLRHSHTNEFLRECQGVGLFENESFRGRSHLNEREKRQVALPILIFGQEMVELSYSRQFQDREEGLIRLRNILKDQKSEICPANINKIARSAAILLHRAVRDAVFSVFSQATETLRSLFVNFIPGKVSSSEVTRCVDRLLPELLVKSGDPSSRIHTLAQHTILSIAACPEVRQQHLVAPALSRNIGSGTHPRLALSRMQMLEQIVLSQGISTDKQSGLTCRILSECGCSGIHHPAEAVRKVAERVLLLVYRVNPRLVRKQLPPDDDITRRNLLYRQLFTEFDKIDTQRHKEMKNLNSNVMGHVGNMGQTSAKVVDSNGKKGFENCRKSVHCKISKYNELNGENVESNEQSQMHPNEQNMAGSNLDDDKKVFEKKYCPFCKWEFEGDGTQLDKHFWKTCPLLTKCWECSQILEVSALYSHLTNECESSEKFIRCSRCTEAVQKEIFDNHLCSKNCKELKSDTSKCPLCHDAVHFPLNGGWKSHLLNGCEKNVRRRSKTQI